MNIEEQLDSFNRFAAQRLNVSGADLTMPDLFELWALENPSAMERSEVAEIIRQGDADIAAGRGEAVDVVNAELQRKYNLPSE